MECNDEVLVVGAGPVGLTAAIALRRLGMQVRIIDKASGTNREPRADVLFPRAGEALGAIGAGERIRDCSYEMQGADIYGDGRRVGSFRVGRLASEFPRAMTIEQHDIEKLLAEELAASGVTVEWHTQATGMEPHEDRVEMTLRHTDGSEERTTAAWVVGCDGSRSQIRAWLGIPFEGSRRKNMQVVQGNVVPSWHLPDRPATGTFSSPHTGRSSRSPPRPPATASSASGTTPIRSRPTSPRSTSCGTWSRRRPASRT